MCRKPDNSWTMEFPSEISQPSHTRLGAVLDVNTCAGSRPCSSSIQRLNNGMTLPTDFQKIADNFARLEAWEDRYRYIIQLGETLPRLQDSERTQSNKVHGCVSQVWLVATKEQRDGQVCLRWRGESDAMIVQGFVAILLALYSGRTVTEIAGTDAIEVFDALGFREHLTMQRSNGLTAMINRIREQRWALSR